MPQISSNTPSSELVPRSANQVEFQRTNRLIPALQLFFDPHLEDDTCLETDHALTLSTSWQDIQPRFAPFKLIETFVNHLIRHKPEKVVFERINGATLDLIRIVQAIGLPMHIQQPKMPTAQNNANAQRWVDALLSQAHTDHQNEIAWNYGIYALGMRDHNLLLKMHQPHVEYLAQSRRILDVGCGTGIMLEALHRAGLQAEGVERDPAAVRFARSMGLHVHEADALSYLEQHTSAYDALYCSHFVEHLPMEAVDRLLGLCARALEPNGLAVFTFPDPESIRSQLLGFWRDPEHVRFYHPELIAAVAQVHGLRLEYNSQNLPARRVVPFSMTPPTELNVPTATRQYSLWQKLLRKLGATPTQDVTELQLQILHQQQLIERLWQVNQTWAWEDNVVLTFRKCVD